MKSKLTTLTAIFLLLFCARAFAQDDIIDGFNGYLINFKNDTIKCQIGASYLSATLTFRLKLRYRVDTTRDFKKINPDSVKEFYWSHDSSTYVSKVLPKDDKPVFVELLEKGRINLYQSLHASIAITMNVSSLTQWYANKNADSLKQIKIASTNLLGNGAIGSHKDREKAFMDMIADNPDLLDRYKAARKSADYSFELIRYYIKTYNDEYLENHKVSK